MLCMFGEDYSVTKGEIVKIEIARMASRYSFALDSNHNNQRKCSTCHDISFF